MKIQILYFSWWMEVTNSVA